VKHTENSALGVITAACSALLVLLSVWESSMPSWASAALVAVLIAALPLLNALGVLEVLGLKDLPGSRFRTRSMYGAVALVAGAILWVIALVRHVPDTDHGVAVLLIPAGVAAAAGLLIRGIV
jgi:hypothetical protein